MAWYECLYGGGLQGIDFMVATSNVANQVGLGAGKAQPVKNACTMDIANTSTCPWNAGSRSTYFAFNTSKTKFKAYVFVRAQSSTIDTAGTNWYPICENATISEVEYLVNTNVIKLAQISVNVTDPTQLVKIGMYTKYSALDLIGLIVQS